MTLTRRRLLQVVIGAAPGTLLAPAPQVPGAPTFEHGVASGDPGPDRVLLWTRVSTGANGPVAVEWWLGPTPDPGTAAASGVAEALASRDHTVHVEVDGLAPATTWYFGFRAGDAVSPTGRTRTAPAAGAPTPAGLRLGLVSCASWPAGHFNAYRHLAERDVDLVVHVGDYIYEDGDADEATGRAHDPPRELRTLADYRARYAQYRRDPDLQLLHQQHPVVPTWDDHEVAADAWSGGAEGHDPGDEGPWAERRAAAVQAWREWLPVRPSPTAGPERAYRTAPLGPLADLVVLDTRLAGRDRPYRAEDGEVVEDDPARSILGAEQQRWLFDQLGASTARWRLLANSVLLAPLRLVDLPEALEGVTAEVGAVVVEGAVVNPGQWDGYPASRRALFDFLRAAGVEDVVVLTGDLHSSWAAELPVDGVDGVEGAGPVGVEVVAPSVSAESFADLLLPDVPGAAALARSAVLAQNPHIRYAELEGHGYVVLDVTEQRVQADWWHVDTVAERRSGERRVAGWAVAAGAARLTEAPAAIPERPARPGPAPPTPAFSRPPPAEPASRWPWVAGGSAAVLAGLAGLLGLRRRRSSGD